MIPHWTPQIIEIPVTVDTDAYTANDVVGGTLTSGAVKQISGGGYIHSVRLVDDSAGANALKLWVFSSAPSTIADDAAHVPVEADLLKCIGVIPIAAADYRTDGTEADCAFVKGHDEKTEDYVVFSNLDSGKLYFRLVCDATPTYADANDLTLFITLMVM